MMAVVAAVAWAMAPLLGTPLPLTTLALGMLASAHPRLPWTRLTSDAPYDVPLAVGMILIGTQFEASVVSSVGLRGTALLLGFQLTVLLAFFATARAGPDGRTWRLMGVALTGCGVSAAFAATEVHGPEGLRERPACLSTTLLVGGFGFVLLPLIAKLAALSPTETATWAGIVMPTTAEAVLIGASAGGVAFRLTGAYRFLVNVLQWIPVLLYARRRVGGDAPPSPWKQIPYFVWGLVGTGVLGLVGAFDAQERAGLGRLANWAFLLSLVGIGMRMRPADLLRPGAARLLAALALWALLATVLLLVVVST